MTTLTTNDIKTGRTSSQISIYDYPEHLNPFYEDEQHKRLRFWKIGNRSSSGKKPGRSNSFSLDGIKDIWTLKSFRLKKRSSTLGVNKTSESPPQLRRLDHYNNTSTPTNYGTYDPRLRNTVAIGINNNFERNSGYRSSLQDMSKVKEDDVFFNRNNRYRNTMSTTQQLHSNTGTPTLVHRNGITVGSSQTSLNSTNPFDEDDDNISMSTLKKPRRKKRRAPPPPVIVPPTTTSEENSIEIHNLTAEIESFVKSSSETTNINEKCDTEQLKTTIRVGTIDEEDQNLDIKQIDKCKNNMKEKQIEGIQNNENRENYSDKIYDDIKIKNTDQEIEREYSNVDIDIMPKDTEKNINEPIIQNFNHDETKKVENEIIISSDLDLENRTTSYNHNTENVIYENVEMEPKHTTIVVKEKVMEKQEAKVVNITDEDDLEKIELPKTPPVPPVRYIHSHPRSPDERKPSDTNKVIEKEIRLKRENIAIKQNLRISESTESIDSPKRSSSSSSLTEPRKIKTENYEFEVRYVPLRGDEGIKESRSEKWSNEYSNFHLRRSSNEDLTETNYNGRRKSVKEIIESINKSQSLLKINQNDGSRKLSPEKTLSDNILAITESTDSLTRNLNSLMEDEKKINLFLAEQPHTNNNDSNYFENLPIVVEQLNEELNNNYVFDKCKPKKLENNNIAWNPVPKPRRSRNISDESP